MKLNFKKLFAITIIGVGIFISQQLHAFMGYDYYMDPTNLPSDMLRENLLQQTFDNYNKVFNNSNKTNINISLLPSIIFLAAWFYIYERKKVK